MSKLPTICRKPFRQTAQCCLSGLILLGILAIPGCSRMSHRTSKNIVYVSARQVYLHDRVAAVSNRTALVTNGEQLEVLERTKRFLKVRTPKNEIGWIEERAIIDGPLYDQFQQLNEQHAKDPVIVSGTLRDDMYLHLKPGRDTDHFILLPENSKLQLLARGSVPKSAPGSSSAQPTHKPAAPLTAKPATGKPGTNDTAQPASSPEPAADPAPMPPPMEDWLLVRDAQNHTGWILSTRMDIDIPAEIEGYSEGQRILGAYLLTHVQDDAVPGPDKTTTESKQMAEYVTVLSEPKNGLPYDFDQVRVFTWSLNHHRYETAFRLRYIKAYLPVTVTQEKVPQGMGAISGSTAPVFSFRIANGDNIAIDPDTGISRPASTRTISFRLDGNLVHRTGTDQDPIPSDKPEAPEGKKKKHR